MTISLLLSLHERETHVDHPSCTYPAASSRDGEVLQVAGNGLRGINEVCQCGSETREFTFVHIMRRKHTSAFNTVIAGRQ